LYANNFFFSFWKTLQITGLNISNKQLHRPRVIQRQSNTVKLVTARAVFENERFFAPHFDPISLIIKQR